MEQLLTRFGRYLPAGGNEILAGLRAHPPTLEDLALACEARDPDAVMRAFEGYMMPWVSEFRARLDARA